MTQTQTTDQPKPSRTARWIRSIVDLVMVVLAVIAAKTAIAEP